MRVRGRGAELVCVGRLYQMHGPGPTHRHHLHPKSDWACPPLKSQLLTHGSRKVRGLNGKQAKIRTKMKK